MEALLSGFRRLCVAWRYPRIDGLNGLRPTSWVPSMVSILAGTKYAPRGALGSRRRPTHVQVLLFRLRGFSSVKDLGNDPRQLVVQQREPLGRLHSFMLCVPGQLYFIPHLILQKTNCEEMQIDILAF